MFWEKNVALGAQWMEALWPEALSRVSAETD